MSKTKVNVSKDKIAQGLHYSYIMVTMSVVGKHNTGTQVHSRNFCWTLSCPVLQTALGVLLNDYQSTFVISSFMQQCQSNYQMQYCYTVRGVHDSIAENNSLLPDLFLKACSHTNMYLANIKLQISLSSQTKIYKDVTINLLYRMS